MVEGTSPGIHGTLIAACAPYRYELLGYTEFHANCTDKPFSAMAESGFTRPEVLVH